MKKMLIPLDRSPLSEQAVGRAAAIARATQAAIDLVLVHEPFGNTLDIGRNGGAVDLTEEHQYLESTAGELRSGASVSVTYAVLTGGASEMICERAKEIEADLIVMTSHARTGIGRLWLGSVADAVVRNASVPVLMLRPVERPMERDAAHHLFKKILVPLDGSLLAAEALGIATEMARASEAELTLLRVIAPVPLLPGRPEYPLSSKPIATSCGTSAGVSPHGGFADGATLSFPVHGPSPVAQTPPPPPSPPPLPLPLPLPPASPG